MNGWKPHTHSDHRGQRTRDAEPLPGGRSVSVMPSSREGKTAVGLNRGRSDGAHRVQDHAPLCALGSPSVEQGCPVLKAQQLHSPQHQHARHVFNCCSCGCHTPTSIQSVSHSRWPPPHRHAHPQGLPQRGVSSS